MMKKIVIYVFLGIGAIFLIGGGGWNFLNNDSFFVFSLYDAVTIFSVIVFAYFYTEINKKEDDIKYQDEDARKYVDRLLDKIEKEVMQIADLDEDIRHITMVQRSISNYFDLLTKIPLSSEISRDIGYTLENFNKYREFFGDKYKNKQSLKQHIYEIERYKRNIQFGIEKIKSSMYIKNTEKE